VPLASHAPTPLDRSWWEFLTRHPDRRENRRPNGKCEGPNVGKCFSSELPGNFARRVGKVSAVIASLD
jgi:hypothetical protein